MSAKILRSPLSEKDVADLKVGDMVLLSGRVFTGRDRVHKFLVNERPDKKEIPFELEGGVIYHCGPIIKNSDQSSPQIIAAGPTTSIRMDMYEAEVIRAFGIRGIIGKGGMGQKTLDAMREYGCVYLHAMSGAAAYLADRIKRVAGGWKVEEFGAPEAMWLLEVEEFPAIVTMDAHGNSLHREIEKASLEKLKALWT
ncbi:MAG TPA: FumA C-terminus/TtdB family hydratase beta subunit [Dissulfurispiraceae bacterium]